jgi:hypothetical protein
MDSRNVFIVREEKADGGLSILEVHASAEAAVVKAVGLVRHGSPRFLSGNKDTQIMGWCICNQETATTRLKRDFTVRVLSAPRTLPGVEVFWSDVARVEVFELIS